MSGTQILFYLLAGFFAGIGFTVAQQLVLILLGLLGSDTWHRNRTNP